MRCGKCGTEVQNSVRYCPNCGMLLICGSCGKPLEVGAAFCGECGASVRNISAAPSRQITERNINKPKKKSSAVLIGAIIAVLLILVMFLCIAVVSFLYFRNVLSDANEPVTEATYFDPYEQSTNSVNEYIEEAYVVTADEDTYLFPSDTRYITKSDLIGKTKEEVAYIRNEIYARHGYVFKNQEYQNYFENKSWYRANPYFDESEFSYIEAANKDFIVEYEKDRGWR